MTGLEVRRAARGDAPLIAPLFDAYRGFYGKPPDLALAERFLAERLERDESVVFVGTARRGCAAVAAGFTQLYPVFSSTRCRPAWILNDLYVAPEFRRTGLGRRLVEAACAHAAETGAAAVELMTAHGNREAQALYEALGFGLDREFRHYVRELAAAP
ncbi:MAG TPA: GNAT family N-acetyltransferase [Gemmatimonadales bacterium]|nr:GNAT family N-acetyltransferase [Gemmatimonadales bacterium]